MPSKTTKTARPQYLTPAEVAEMHGLSVITIRRRIASGELRARRYNSRVIRVELADALALGTDTRAT